MALELNQVLVWLAAGGSLVAISWCAENWGWFQKLEGNKKRLAMWASASVLGMAALAITTYVPAETLAAIAPYFKIALANFASIFLLEFFHAKSKA